MIRSARARATGLGLAFAACLLGAPQAPASPGWVPKSLETRFLLGHDANLLDASDRERVAFETGDSSAYFAVDRMADQFLEGLVESEWRLGHFLGMRPALQLVWRRQQYLRNPIKSEDRLGARLRVRPGDGTRVDLEGAWLPQEYGRHRFDRDALPGEPQFRPEVRRRGILSLKILQQLAAGISAGGGLEGTVRRYRAPFEERDRDSFGGHAEVGRTFGKLLQTALRGGYERAWARNEPGDPDDRSFTAWKLETVIESRALPVLSRIRLAGELEWRRYTSSDPDDQDHFGRHDQAGEVGVEVARALSPSLAWVASVQRAWRTPDLPTLWDFEESAFEDTELRSGVQWNWEP